MAEPRVRHRRVRPRRWTSTNRSSTSTPRPSSASTPTRPTRPPSSTSEGTVVVELDTEQHAHHHQQLREPRPLRVLRRHRPVPHRGPDRDHPGRLAPHPGQHATRARATRSPTRACRSPGGLQARRHRHGQRRPRHRWRPVFFVSPGDGQLPGRPGGHRSTAAGAYAVFGQATEGLDVLQAISDSRSRAPAAACRASR